MILNIIGALWDTIRLDNIIGTVIRHAATTGAGVLIALGILEPDTGAAVANDLSGWLEIALGGFLATLGLGASSRKLR